MGYAYPACLDNRKDREGNRKNKSEGSNKEEMRKRFLELRKGEGVQRKLEHFGFFIWGFSSERRGTASYNDELREAQDYEAK